MFTMVVCRTANNIASVVPARLLGPADLSANIFWTLVAKHLFPRSPASTFSGHLLFAWSARTLVANPRTSMTTARTDPIAARAAKR